jgi:hypothetical protein
LSSGFSKNISFFYDNEEPGGRREPAGQAGGVIGGPEKRARQRSLCRKGQPVRAGLSAMPLPSFPGTGVLKKKRAGAEGKKTGRGGCPVQGIVQYRKTCPGKMAADLVAETAPDPDGKSIFSIGAFAFFRGKCRFCSRDTDYLSLVITAPVGCQALAHRAFPGNRPDLFSAGTKGTKKTFDGEGRNTGNYRRRRETGATASYTGLHATGAVLFDKNARVLPLQKKIKRRLSLRKQYQAPGLKIKAVHKAAFARFSAREIENRRKNTGVPVQQSPAFPESQRRAVHTGRLVHHREITGLFEYIGGFHFLLLSP